METERDLYLKELQADPLNDLLDQLEIDLSRLGQLSPTQATQMLIKMDVAVNKISTMAAAHNPVVAESAQFDYLVKSIEKHCSDLLHDLGGKEALFSQRAVNSPAAQNSWWFPDRTRELQNRKKIRKFSISLAAFVVVMGVLWGLYSLLLKPDPAVIARYNHEMDADLALARNDLPGALKSVNQALDIGGDTASLLVLRGVVETLMGQMDQAALDFKMAEEKLGSRIDFLMARAEAWIKVGQFDYAQQDATDAIGIDPTSAQAFFYFGKAKEMKQEYNAAIDAYEKASSLAELQGKVELNATIRISMAMLMQSSIGQFPTVVLTPTPR